MTRRRLRRSPAAEADLLDIWTYLAPLNIGAADRTLDRIANVEDRLVDFPLHGVLRDDVGSGLRAVVVREYILFYRASEDGIEVVRVIDGRRMIRPTDFDD